VSLLQPPSEEEAAAIVAAVEVLWPRPRAETAGEQAAPVTAWRFSGRWWARPQVARRDRPWRW
jgi:hypothetical protein